MDKKQRDWLCSKIRIEFAKMPGYKPRDEIWKQARVGYGKYQCALCKGIFGPKDVQRDHIEPVVDPATGFVDWNTWFARLDAPIEGWQVICKPCHYKKSAEENSKRKKSNG
jgi:5-methylcytosine-specific restriction endonuclease McrA